MHLTAEQNARRFFDTYVNQSDQAKILEIGSQLGGFNIRSLAPTTSTYIGIDLEEALGVDVVLTDEYKFPFESNSFDYVISSSCFEHIEFFWLSFLEIMRILKPGGLFYLNAPSNGAFHRYPVDCWRFFPDSGFALARWSKYNQIECEVLEQYTSNNETDIWSDYVVIFSKGITTQTPESRILHTFNNYTNGSIYPGHQIMNINTWK
jgi:SAM-dependent methyltransferase